MPCVKLNKELNSIELRALNELKRRQLMTLVMAKSIQSIQPNCDVKARKLIRNLKSVLKTFLVGPSSLFTNSKAKLGPA